MHAAFVKKKDKGSLVCGLCPHRCVVSRGELGDCHTRQNVQDTLRVVTYGRLSAEAVDPIEKKPLFHYRPGTQTYSIASMGCNLKCPFCQNHTLSRGLDTYAFSNREALLRSPEQVVSAAKARNSRTISFTYSEPVLMFEFARDVAAIARSENMSLVFVTNGQINETPARELSTFIGAANVDLKCFSKPNYKDVLGGSLTATLRTMEILAAAGVWLEVTTLVIPGFNDTEEEIRSIAQFIAGLDRSIPWHVSRFHPAYLWNDRESTSPKTLSRIRDIGLKQGLNYVYTGNIPGDDGEKTYCPECKNTVIDRRGYRVAAIATQKGKCSNCGASIAGVGLP